MLKRLSGPRNREIEVNRISTELTESGMAAKGQCVFKGFIIKTDGSNDVTLNIYDNEAAAAGNRLIPADTVIPGAAYLYRFPVEPGIWCDYGIYITISVAGGGSCSVMVLYDQ